MFSRHRRTNSMHRVQNGECLHYRARSSSPLTFAGALRDVVIVGQERETRCHPPPPSTAPHVQGADNSVDGDDDDEDEECVICSGSLNADDKPVSAIQACEHKFHDACIRGWLERLGGRTSPHCPVCRAEVPMRPKPLSPSGTMTIQLGDDVCPGFEQNTTCIEIIYNLPTGRQHVFHDNPSTRYPGTTRRAYLPNNGEGRELLKRLQSAFSQGLTFDIGTSLTSGWHDQIVWARAFDHKTSLHGGPYGFPDPNYLDTCNVQLDAIGVPSATDLPDLSVPNGSVIAYDAPQTLGPPALMPNALKVVERSGVVRNPPLQAVGADPNPPQPAASAVPCQNPPPDALLQNHGHVVVETPSVTIPNSECSICHKALSDRVASQVILCKHVFHQDCIQYSLNLTPRCPVCRRTVGEPQGSSPSGTMTINRLTYKVPGFSRNPIEIMYRVPSGVQESYHDNPGARFDGTRRLAYLPDTPDGRRLLTRLKYAFAHGLTFTVGSSLTTGRSNVVTWTSIPHKTSFDGPNDPHGFPDDRYFANCNDALDALGVPDADECLSEPQAVSID